MNASPMQPPPKASSGSVGRLVKISTPTNAPATTSACGREKSCFRNCTGRSTFWVLRVTSKPAASDVFLQRFLDTPADFDEFLAWSARLRVAEGSTYDPIVYWAQMYDTRRE